MLVNVLVHREFTNSRPAWFIIRRDEMFTDNANKALHYGVITPKNLEPEPKNPIIANFFHQIQLADELGSGERNLYKYVRIYSGVSLHANSCLTSSWQFQIRSILTEAVNFLIYGG